MCTASPGISQPDDVTKDPEGKIYFRHYKTVLLKSGTNIPRVELIEIGPSMDLVMRRMRFAGADLWKEATRVPKGSKKRKIKNTTTTRLATLATIHTGRQDFNSIQTRKNKALKRTRSDKDVKGKAVEGGEGQEEGGGGDDVKKSKKQKTSH